MRIACAIAYQGQQYFGWQRQSESLPTIQEYIEKALSVIAAEPVTVYCAGRTDAGVHASYQIIHFDTRAKRQNYAWVFGCNAYLPPDIRVLWAKPVADNFHARHSALSRQYRYFIDNKRVHVPYHYGRTTWIPYPLDWEVMQGAAQHLLGEHDFSAFRDSDCQSKTVHRQVRAITVSYQQDLVVVEITANAFLHHMVRNIVGVLLEIGRGRQNADWIKTVLASADRKQAAETAPASGLYLTDIQYPVAFAIPTSVSGVMGGIDAQTDDNKL